LQSLSFVFGVEEAERRRKKCSGFCFIEEELIDWLDMEAKGITEIREISLGCEL